MSGGQTPESRRRYRQAHRTEHRVESRRRYQQGPGRWAQMWRNHGLRPESWMALWTEQDGLCYLCEEPMPVENSRIIVIEHDHRCCPPLRSCWRCRRGLAHMRCNTAIGLADDDPALLRRIAANLERAQRRIAANISGNLTLFDAEPARPDPIAAWVRGDPIELPPALKAAMLAQIDRAKTLLEADE